MATPASTPGSDNDCPFHSNKCMKCLQPSDILISLDLIMLFTYNQSLTVMLMIVMACNDNGDGNM